jgi:hypothetical protein
MKAGRMSASTQTDGINQVQGGLRSARLHTKLIEVSAPAVCTNETGTNWCPFSFGFLLGRATTTRNMTARARRALRVNCMAVIF